jgi:exosortase K
VKGSSDFVPTVQRFSSHTNETVETVTVNLPVSVTWLNPGVNEIERFMNVRIKWKLASQLIVVVGSAALIKLYYSTASVNNLRWILAPTTALVEFISGTSFEFESHAGYMSSDHTFLIAASCAGVNFLITAFLMLSLRKLWRDRGKQIPWGFFGAMAVLAYLATLVANTVRISSSLLLRGMPLEFGLTVNQLHRFEGIFIYFGFLLLLFLLSEKFGSGSLRTISGADRLGWLRRSLFPLLLYYSITLGIPFANGAFSQGNTFLEHSLFVVLTSLLMMLPIVMFQFYRRERAKHAFSVKPGA